MFLNKFYKLYFFYLILLNIIFAQSKTTKIQGIVFDDKTNEKLAGVTITISDSAVAVTNNKGFFSFSVALRKFNVSVKMLGYEKETKTIKLEDSEKEATLFFRLIPKPIKINLITVSGKKYYEKVKYKTYELQQGDFRRIPQVGETDALRAFQALPSVTSLNDFSAQLYLRGGNFDETLIALDDVPVYNPYHLGSFFSMFNTDIIEKETLYPSNYPNKYGGYLSGALNIQTKPGNFENINSSVSIGLVSSKFYSELPIGKGSLILAGRRTYFDLVAALFYNRKKNIGEFPYYFYDGYAKYNYPIDKKNQISLSLLLSRDLLKMFDDNLYSNINVSQKPTWGNDLYNFKYIHLFNDKISIVSQIYYTSSSFVAKGESYYNSKYTRSKINNIIKDVSYSVRLNYKLTGQDIQLGFVLKKINLSYDWNLGKSELSSFGFNAEDTFFDFAPKIFLENNKEEFYNIFFRDKIIFTKSLNITLGFRTSYLKYSKINLLTPSFNINYKINDNIDLTFSYGKYFQYLYVKKDRNTFLLDPFSVYFLPKDKAQFANSSNTNINIIFNKFIFGTSLEISGYYNKRRHLFSFYPQELNHYSYENGYSTGIEILLKKKIGYISGWLSYTLSRSAKSNGDYYYPIRIDRTHNIKILFNIQLSESWFFSAFWTFATGLPYTPIIGKYIGGETVTLKDNFYDDDDFSLFPIMGSKNSKRTPAYHRLDIGLSGSLFWGKFLFKPYLQILNVYNSPNVIGFEKRNRSMDDTVRGSIIVPTIGVVIDF